MKCKECGRLLGTTKGNKICTDLFCIEFGKPQSQSEAKS